MPDEDDQIPGSDPAGDPEPPRERDREKDRDRDKGGDRDTLAESIRARVENLVPELVKKTFAAGMGAVFQTEEGIRKFAREVNLPDVAGYIADSADGAKDKVFEVIARETREFLANLNIGDELAKMLTRLSFEIKTEIRFIPNSERVMGAEPDVKASVRLKRTDEDDKKDEKKDDKKDEKKDDKKDDDKDDSRESRSRLRFWRRDDRGEGSGNDDEDDSHDK